MLLCRFVCGIIIILMIISTLCDLMWPNEEKLHGGKSILTGITVIYIIHNLFLKNTILGSPIRNLCVSFSIIKNYPKLGRSEDSNSALGVLYGMRVFCMCMIITDHRFGTFLSSGIMNFDTVEEVGILDYTKGVLKI